MPQTNAGSYPLPAACSVELSPLASRAAFKNLETIMKCIVTAINEAAPRASDIYAYPHLKRAPDAPSNVGRKVVLRGLVTRQDLNGCYATIMDEPR
jgi:hypothetical protein